MLLLLAMLAQSPARANQSEVTGYSGGGADIQLQKSESELKLKSVSAVAFRDKAALIYKLIGVKVWEDNRWYTEEWGRKSVSLTKCNVSNKTLMHHLIHEHLCLSHVR